MKRALMRVVLIGAALFFASCGNGLTGDAGEETDEDLSKPKVSISVGSASSAKSNITVSTEEIAEVRTILTLNGTEVSNKVWPRSEWGQQTVLDLEKFGTYELTVLEYGYDGVIIGEQEAEDVPIEIGTITKISITPGGCYISVGDTEVFSYNFTKLKAIPNQMVIYNDPDYLANIAFSSEGVAFSHGTGDNIGMIAYPIDHSKNWRYKTIVKPENFRANSNSVLQIAVMNPDLENCYQLMGSIDSAYYGITGSGFFSGAFVPIGTTVGEIVHLNAQWISLEITFNKASQMYTGRLIQNGTVVFESTVPAVTNATRIVVGANAWSMVDECLLVRAITLETW